MPKDERRANRCEGGVGLSLGGDMPKKTALAGGIYFVVAYEEIGMKPY
jgi:hypothetical protein